MRTEIQGTSSPHDPPLAVTVTVAVAPEEGGQPGTGGIFGPGMAGPGKNPAIEDAMTAENAKKRKDGRNGRCILDAQTQVVRFNGHSKPLQFEVHDGFKTFKASLRWGKRASQLEVPFSLECKDYECVQAMASNWNDTFPS